MDLNIFSVRLKTLRSESKVSSASLASSVGVSRPAISQFENAANAPSIDTLIALADYFDVSIDYLVGRSDDPDRVR